MSGPDATPPADDSFLSRTVTIVNRRGLHARAAARFVKTAERFQAEITVVRKESVVSGLSIMGLMMLAAEEGSTLTILSNGPDEADVHGALEKLFTDRFGEKD